MPESRLVMPPSRAKLVAGFAAIYLIWGSTYLAIRFAIETLPPFLMAGTRFLAAGAILYCWARLRGSGPPSPGQWRIASVIGVLLFLGGNGALTWSEQRVPSGLAALLLATIPIWMVLLDAAGRKGTRLGGWLIAGLVMGLAGLALLVGPSELLGGKRVDPLGAGVLLFGSISWALGSLYAQRARLRRSMLATALGMLAGGTFLLLAGLLSGELSRLDPGHVSLRSVLGLLYLITFGSLVGFSAYMWLLGVTSAARVSTYAYVNPVVAVLLGWAVGGEALTARTVLATAVIVGAVALLLTHPHPTPAVRQAEAAPEAGAEAEVLTTEEG